MNILDDVEESKWSGDFDTEVIFFFL